MNPFDPGVARSHGAVHTTASASRDVRLIRPDRPSGLPVPISKSASHGRSERADAWIVLGLTFACTALSLYDLLLLASGS